MPANGGDDSRRMREEVARKEEALKVVCGDSWCSEGSSAVVDGLRISAIMR